MSDPKKPRVAVVGAGVAGISAAYYLSRFSTVTLYEKASRLGGHTNTVEANSAEGTVPVDTGFIVCNDKTYPLFHQLLHDLKVPVRYSDMSFGYHDRVSEEGYSVVSPRSWMNGGRNLLKPQFLKMWIEIFRFNRRAICDLEQERVGERTLREYAADQGVSQFTIDWYLVPMAAAIWSSSDEDTLEMPARTFLSFYRNHGLLKFSERPRWQTVVGGSYQYLKAFQSCFTGEIRLNAGVHEVSRGENSVAVVDSNGGRDSYDYIFLAAHADETLQLLRDPSEQEKQIFAQWRYSRNHTVLHTHSGVLPPRREMWASWNYVRESGSDLSQPLTMSYYMNRLQGLEGPTDYIVTLNPVKEIPEDQIIAAFDYTHPVFSPEAVATQPKIDLLNGERRTFYCGSYCGFGFHEDAVRSSHRAIRTFRKIVKEEEFSAGRTRPEQLLNGNPPRLNREEGRR